MAALADVEASEDPEAVASEAEEADSAGAVVSVEVDAVDLAAETVVEAVSATVAETGDHRAAGSAEGTTRTTKLHLISDEVADRKEVEVALEEARASTRAR